MCQREVNNDRFFVAREGNRVKTGSLLDVTSDEGAPKAFIISWGFTDENNNYLETGTLPQDTGRDYIKSDGRVYAENIAYRELHLNDVKRMKITLELKKYVNQSDAPNDLAELKDRDELERIDLCVVDLK